MRKVVTIPLTLSEKRGLLNSRISTDPNSPLELSDGNWDFSEFLEQCRDRIDPKKPWSMPNVFGGWFGLAKYHVTSPDGKGLSEAVKCLEKAQSADHSDDRAPYLNVYLQTKHLRDAYQKTKSYKDCVRFIGAMEQLKKDNPALAKIVDAQVKAFSEDYGGIVLILYRWENKTKECWNNTLNWFRNESWAFLFRNKKYIIGLAMVLAIRYLPPELQGIIYQSIDDFNRFLTNVK